MFSIPVIHLLKDASHELHLKLIAGKEGLKKRITIPRIQKPGLALVGNISNLHPGRIQVLGKAEINYLSSLKKADRNRITEKMCCCDIACFIITRQLPVLPEMVKACDRHDIALLSTHLLTSTFVNRASRFLDETLSASTCIHGVLLDVFGVGVLLIGKSGIGKSECALDLVLRGHRLVADDIVNVKKKPPATLFGTGSEIIKHHMEIRGLGIINIKDLFGISAVRDRKFLEIVVELLEWDPTAEYDRLGVEEQRYTLLDVDVPLIQIPVRPGRNLSAIIEVAVRNHLLKLGGYHAAREFQERLSKEITAVDEKQKREEQMMELLE
ncbi:MAG: HPr(Ser) kinase/phosphatase [Deltaproteobacteria bacterium]|nr:HPr(Ser) kinase/phosphatase [Deltaproteobacteria bacterium]